MTTTATAPNASSTGDATASDTPDTLTLIVPLEGELADLAAVVAAAEAHIPRPFTAYVIHDPATDSALLAAARGLAARRDWLRLLPNRFEPGVGGALRTVLEVTRAGPLLVTVPDAGDDLSLAPAILELYRAGNRVVCPSRFARGGAQRGGSAAKRALLRATGALLERVVGFPTRDLNNNYRLYDAALVREVGIESTSGFAIALELTAKAVRRGARVAELPTTWTDRRPQGARAGTGAWLRSYLRWVVYALSTEGRRPR